METSTQVVHILQASGACNDVRKSVTDSVAELAAAYELKGIDEQFDVHDDAGSAAQCAAVSTASYVDSLGAFVNVYRIIPEHRFLTEFLPEL